MPPTTFSHSLSAIDLNDYLGPSQLCIKPAPKPPSPPTASASTEIRLDESTQSYYEAQAHDRATETKLSKAQISLDDCLACSGCITSSESVLVSLQSVDEVLKAISEQSRCPVVSISSHSLASFAAYNRLESLSAAFETLKAYFLTRLRSRLVLDLGFAQQLHLWESRREFSQRRAAPSGQGKRTALLASSCPGWICYAEKTQGKTGVLGMISEVRSAQQIQGALVKSARTAAMLGCAREQIYHVCVMSCYDKKLEASRPDFQQDGVKDVDCVLTTREVQTMMEQDGFAIKHAGLRPELHGTLPAAGDVDLPVWIDHRVPKGSSSGGYLFNVLRSVARDVPSDERSRLKLVVDRKRGADHTEYLLLLQSKDESGQEEARSQTLFRGARFYGFKNLQNLIRKLGTVQPVHPRLAGRRRKALEQEHNSTSERGFDYVEVMACPSGCVNGGGQIPAPKATEANEANEAAGARYSAKEWVGEVERKYFQSGGVDESLVVDYLEFDELELEEEKAIERWLKAWGADDEQKRRELLRTSYRAVEAEVNGFAVQW